MSSVAKAGSFPLALVARSAQLGIERRLIVRPGARRLPAGTSESGRLFKLNVILKSRMKYMLALPVTLPHTGNCLCLKQCSMPLPVTPLRDGSRARISNGRCPLTRQRAAVRLSPAGTPWKPAFRTYTPPAAQKTSQLPRMRLGYIHLEAYLHPKIASYLLPNSFRRKSYLHPHRPRLTR